LPTTLWPLEAEGSPADASERRWIEVNGAAAYVEQHGSDMPVVLIHGGLLSSAMWGRASRAEGRPARDHARQSWSRALERSADLIFFLQIADGVAVLIGELRLERPAGGRR